MESQCPKCSSQYAYQDGNLWICPECSYEWSALASSEDSVEKDVDIVHCCKMSLQGKYSSLFQFAIEKLDIRAIR